MPKKGKGQKKKGKAPDESAPVEVEEPPGLQAAARAPKKKEKDVLQESTPSEIEEPPGVARAPKKTDKDVMQESRPFPIEEPPGVTAAGRGRGRGRGKPMKSPPMSLGASASTLDVRGSPISAGSSAERKSSTQDTERQKEILSKMAGLSLQYQDTPFNVRKFPTAKRPSRPARIDDRNGIRLLVNYFKLEYKKDVVVYHYDIDIYDSDKKNKKGRSVFAQEKTKKGAMEKKVKFVEHQKQRNMGKAKCRQIISDLFNKKQELKKFCPIYDGRKNLFTSRPLPCKNSENVFEIDVEIENGVVKKFFVAITPVEKEDETNIISLEPLINLYAGRSTELPNEVILVYETLLAHREPPFKDIQFRNSFYSFSTAKVPLGGGLDVWFGYHQAVQLTQRGPVVVINLAAKAYHRAGPVIDYINDVLGSDIRRENRLQPWQIQKLDQALKGLTIKVTHQRQPRKYKIRSITKEAANEIMQDIEGERMSVAQYIQKKYKKLFFPYLPCLHMQSSNKTYIPIELCEVIDGQPKVGKLSAEHTAKMIRSTAVPPQERRQKIEQIVRQVNDNSRKYMGAFGLLMDIKLMKVDGRVIAAPQLRYHGANVRPEKPDERGVWRIEDGKKFYNIVKIHKWSLISFANKVDRQALEKYCKMLVRSATKCGMEMNQPQSIVICDRNMKSEVALKRAKDSGMDFIIVVLNRQDNMHTYDEIKFLADFKYNLVTQCMEDKTIWKCNDQITTNVCLKINVKLGGINHTLFNPLQAFKQPIIVFGIDAIHWPRGYGYPSIISVVGSLNPSATKYALVCDTQTNDRTGRISQEIIKNMKKPALKIFEHFQRVNGAVEPQKLVVFRDGVSEGQFQHALDYEVSGIQEACREKYGRILHITYIVVQKRHQTRFFPENPRDGVGRQRNVPPGTAVDKDITHPVFYDFFICSHEGIQGTSKPARYTVLHDDNEFETEELQQLCYFLCHTYVRCTRSVSLPAPIMYADLAAARAKKYADVFVHCDTQSVHSEDSEKNLPPQVEEAIKSMSSFDHSMFYV